MYRATTPKLTLEVEDDIDFTTATDIYITITDKDYATLLEKHGNDVTVESKKRISTVLSQSESLGLPAGTSFVQVNYLYDVDGDTRRGATDRAEVHVYKNNKEVVIE